MRLLVLVCLACVYHRVLAGKYDHWWDDGDCYPGDKVGTYMSMGVAVSHRLAYSRWNGQVDTHNKVNKLFSEVNSVFRGQLNLDFNVTTLYIGDGSEPFDNSDCTKHIEHTLATFNAWVETQPQQVSLWHLLDDCFLGYCQKNCPVGVTSKHSRACIPHARSSVTYVSSSTWTTIAHEIGHNTGADHSFDNGKGTTGGLMDYWLDNYLGIPQFNTNFAKDDLCEGVTEAIARCGTDTAFMTYKTTPPRTIHDHPHSSAPGSSSSDDDEGIWWLFVIGAVSIGTVAAVVICSVRYYRDKRPAYNPVPNEVLF